jgi:hypothetical protein
MAARVSRGVKKKWIIIGLAGTFALALLGGAAAHRAASGQGRLQALARALYRQYKAARLQQAYAAQMPPERADAPLTIYDDALGRGWQDWSWASRDLASGLRVHRGKRAISMTPEGYKGLYLHHEGLGTAGYGALEVWVHGQPAVNVCVVDGGGKFGPQAPLGKYCPATPHAAGWNVARIPLTELGVAKLGGRITGIVFQASGSARQPDVFFDSISLQPDRSLPPAPTRVTVAVSVDMSAGGRPISPYIYGMAFAPKAYLTDLRLGSNRWGGNDKSRYNWVHGNATNAARDWRWANRTAWWHGSAAPALAPGPSSAADHFTRDNRAEGVETLLTIPTIGWVAKDSDHNTTSVNVPEQGGVPRTTAEGAVAGYDPADNRRRTSVRSLARKGKPFTDTPTLAGGVIYQDEWVHHLVRTFGTAARGGVRFYAMDNEPDLWDSTHTDIRPARMGYDDLLATFLEYATAVKDVDPTAQVTGPVSWGWTGYHYSPLDRGGDGYRTHADRRRHGGDPFLLWFLKRVRAHDSKSGRRTLDVLDVHYYPQGQGLYQGSLDKDAQARRLRATRSLWDPKYVDESWIGEPVRLIALLKEWIAAGYPGTKIGITEWNFGADTDINGALAIADVLGIYGREGVYLANYWAHPPHGSPGYLAFKLYRNADGRGRGFGDISCRAMSADPDRVSCFAATDTPSGELTLVLVNKMRKATVTAPITVKGAQRAGGVVKTWRLSADNPNVIVASAGPRVQGGMVTLLLPPYSATLVRLATGRSSQ